MAAKSEYTRGRVHAYKHPDNGRWYVRFVHQNRREHFQNRRKHFSLKVTRRTLAEKEANEINDLLECRAVVEAQEPSESQVQPWIDMAIPIRRRALSCGQYYRLRGALLWSEWARSKQETGLGKVTWLHSPYTAWSLEIPRRLCRARER